jgi:hypothetical protein
MNYVKPRMYSLAKRAMGIQPREIRKRFGSKRANQVSPVSNHHGVPAILGDPAVLANGKSGGARQRRGQRADACTSTLHGENSGRLSARPGRNPYPGR